KHAVAASVVQHRDLERDHSWAAGGQRDVRHHCVIGIEVDEAGLHCGDLVLLVQVQQVGDVFPDAVVFTGGGVDGAGQVRVGSSQTFDRSIVQTGGQAAAGVRAKRGEGAEYGHAHLQK